MSGDRIDINKIKQEIDPVAVIGQYLELRKSGSEWEALCPFHKEKTPSFKVNPSGFICFGCLDEDEPVWTDKGLKRIGDIATGDLVYDIRGRLQTVLATEHKHGPAIEISLGKFRRDPLRLTPDHKCVFVKQEDALSALSFLWWSSKRERVRFKQKYYESTRTSRNGKSKAPVVTEDEASKIKPGDYVLFPVLPLQHRAFTSLKAPWLSVRSPHGPQTKRIEELPASVRAARLYGYYLAEGSTDKRNVVFTFSIDEKDTLARDCAELLSSEFGLRSKTHVLPERSTAAVVCSKVDLARQLEYWFGKGAQNKKIPGECLNWPPSLQKSLLSAYAAGDGDGRGCMVTISPSLAYGVYALSIQVGEKPSLGRNSAYTGKDGVSRKASWNMWSRAPHRPDGFFWPINGTNYYWTAVSDVVSGDGSERNVVDISVTGSETFLTKLGAIHNCGAKGDVLRFIQEYENLEFQEAAARLSQITGQDLLTNGNGCGTNGTNGSGIKAYYGPPPQQPNDNEPQLPGPSRRPLPFASGAALPSFQPTGFANTRADIGKLDAEYTYVDEEGLPLFLVKKYVRIDEDGERKKTFLQFRPDSMGRWAAGINDRVTGKPMVRIVLYRLDRIVNAAEVWVTEGEKDTHTLEAQGVCATTNSGGAKKPWIDEFTRCLAGKDVIIVPDNDAPGIQRGETIERELRGKVRSVTLLRLPEGFKDVTEFIEAGNSVEDLRALAEEARATCVVFPVRYDWRTMLITSASGAIKACLSNVITALRHAPEWNGLLAYNEFTLGTFALKSPPWPGGRIGEWSDQEDRLCADWMQKEEIFVNVDTVGAAIQTVSRDRSFHPVRDYLESLQWDGVSRIDTWTSRLLGADFNSYTSAVGSRWLISAVARIFHPGSKADCCLILEGSQGIKKSTALKTLGAPWFTDEIADLGSKDAAMQTNGVWIIEISELDSMARSEVGRVKAFISRTNDRFRPPYGKRVIESPRQCVFSGSTNQNVWMRDETGARRFWPIACRLVNIDQLAIERDQLWAEAVACYRSGYVWWLDKQELMDLAENEQADRYEGDAWDDVMGAWLRSPKPRRETPGGPPLEPWTSDVGDVTVADVLVHCIGKRIDQWTVADKNRVGRCLKSLGWERFRRSDKERTWAYRPKGTSRRG